MCAPCYNQTDPLPPGGLLSRTVAARRLQAAILPGLLIKNVIGICEKVLAELAATRRHPALVREMTVREIFALSDADQWDALRSRFRNKEG